MPRDPIPRDIVILDGARTAIGTFGGALAGTPPIATAAHVAKAAMERLAFFCGRKIQGKGQETSRR